MVLERFVIAGGTPLGGETAIHGAKNSVLALLAATALCKGETVLHNCPDLSDVRTSIAILRHLGCRVTRQEDVITVCADGLTRHDIPDEMMTRMRSSILFLGAILARAGRAQLTYPGGCALGARPIDYHLLALERLGAEIEKSGAVIRCLVPQKLHGASILFPFPSVGATENALLAAVLAEGETIIRGGAREPEIADLICFLNRCGGKIRTDGDGNLMVSGVMELTGCDYHVMPDRMEAATYLCCGAISGGDILLQTVCPEHLGSVLPVLGEMGCRISTGTDHIALHAPRRLRAVKEIMTMPYPGFPTDAQAPFMALASVADGTTTFTENIFENRYAHVGELARMGADIIVSGKTAVVSGVRKLHGAEVSATDLRGGACLVEAALAAEGLTVVSGVGHIDRGYERMEQKLTELGAQIKRIGQCQERWGDE